MDTFMKYFNMIKIIKWWWNDKCTYCGGDKQEYGYNGFVKCKNCK